VLPNTPTNNSRKKMGTVMPLMVMAGYRREWRTLRRNIVVESRRV
jgi:hypothetical protein